MPPDYPAAHSMDTTWYAVDRDGHVASFTSHEAGAVPLRFLNWRAALQADTFLPPIPDMSGLFAYEHANRFESNYMIPVGDLWLHEGPRVFGPYIRDPAPAQPWHLDQFPPALRVLFTTVRFASLSFADERAVQPVEHFYCDSHQSEYLTLAGERRPFPQEGT